MRMKFTMAMLMAVLVAAPAMAEDKAEQPKTDAAATEQTAADAVLTATEGRILLRQDLDYDTAYGDVNAPITIVEYASLSCTHCRDFYMNVFDKVKENYIDKGKVRFIFRHYPLNINALRGAMVAECALGEDIEKKKTFIGAMFQSQPEWAFKEDEKEVVEKLKSIAKLGGYDTSKFDECASKKELEDALLTRMLQTQKALAVSATPTIFINEKQYYGKKDYEDFAKALEEATANIGKDDSVVAGDKTEEKSSEDADKKAEDEKKSSKPE